METSTILRQIHFWQTAAKITTYNLPLCFGLLYLFDYIKPQFILHAVAVVSITISIVWWFWAIYAISFLSQILDRSGKDIQEVIREVHEVRDDIHDLKNSSRNRKR